jgi:hypothetical protein
MERKATTAGADCVLLASVEIGPGIVVSRIWMQCSRVKIPSMIKSRKHSVGTEYGYLKEKFDLPELVPSREEFAVTLLG